MRGTSEQTAEWDAQPGLLCLLSFFYLIMTSFACISSLLIYPWEGSKYLHRPFLACFPFSARCQQGLNVQEGGLWLDGNGDKDAPWEFQNKTLSANCVCIHDIGLWITDSIHWFRSVDCYTCIDYFRTNCFPNYCSLRVHMLMFNWQNVHHLLAC